MDKYMQCVNMIQKEMLYQNLVNMIQTQVLFNLLALEFYI
jgi:hypothetical protein